MKHLCILPLAATALLSSANAQNVLNYWDFSSLNDSVGGVTGTAVGTPDLSVDATYGEAYAGSGPSLNIVFNLQDYIIADTHDGVGPTALDFGTGDFSFSYWSYDDNSDGNTRGPRPFDCLDGTSTGVQLATNGTGIYNLRVDTSDGGASISNNTLTTLIQPSNQWVHVSVNVDRTNDQYEIFFDGASQGVVGLSAPNAGGIFATKDMDIGVINSEGTGNQSENNGLDDLAFYDGLLDMTSIAGLANATLTPLDFFGGSATDICNGDGGDQAGCTNCPCGNNAAQNTIGGCINQSGSSARLLMSGSSSVTAMDPMDLRFDMTGGNPNTLAVLTSGDNVAPQNMTNPCFGLDSGVLSSQLDGLRCAVGNTQRHGGRPMDASGDVGLTNNGWGGASGPGGGLAAQGGFVAGQTRYFQVFYRTDATLGCMTGQNTTQAVKVDFVP